MYTQSTAKVKTERVVHSFQLGRGVRQDDPMSPKLCTYVLDNVFRNLNWGNRLDLRINDNRLYNLRFADDILLVASSARALQQMQLDLNEYSKTTGLTMNLRKTKIISNRAIHNRQNRDKTCRGIHLLEPAS